jgi:hypothetical protein
MIKILIDTCVWLDLAKDYQQRPLLRILEELIQRQDVSLIVPRVVINEFEYHKKRIIKESNQGISSVIKRVKDVVSKFGDSTNKGSLLNQLDDIDYKIPLLGGTAVESVSRIEQLLYNSTIIEASDDNKIRAAQRAIDKKAPFHLKKNSINDALLIEIYADCVQDKSLRKSRFAFITHNISDFSLPNGNNKLPHPDIASLFSKIKSLYFINLAEALYKFHPEFVNESMIEEEWIEEPRKLTDIVQMIGELIDKVWYNRHMNWLYKIKIGQHQIVENNSTEKYEQNTTPRYIYEGARKSAKKLEKQYGIKNLGPWDDFEWGMLNGKLSALRWVLGDEWDSLDT